MKAKIEDVMVGKNTILVLLILIALASLASVALTGEFIGKKQSIQEETGEQQVIEVTEAPTAPVEETQPAQPEEDINEPEIPPETNLTLPEENLTIPETNQSIEELPLLSNIGILSMTLEWRYQENANATGNTTLTWNNVANVRDGNWTTFGDDIQNGVGDSYAYANYSKPTGAKNALWQIKDTGTTTNLTVPDACFNQSIVQFSVLSSDVSTPIANRRVNWTCWNGAAWQELRTYSNLANGDYVYEEAVWWNITADIDNCANLTTPNIEYTLTSNLNNCQAPSGSSNKCISVSGNNITFDCAGHTIDSNDSSQCPTGILVNNTQGITLKNCNVSDYYTTGIQIINSTNVTITNSSIISIVQDGISLLNSTNVTLNSVNLTGNSIDFKTQNTTGATARNMTFNKTRASFTYSGDFQISYSNSSPIFPTALPANFYDVGTFLNITNQTSGGWMFLNLSYNESALNRINESTLELWKHHADWIYEESGDGTPDCGPLQWNNEGNVYDGNWSTYGDTTGTFNAYCDVAYTKPANVYNSSRWQFKDGLGTNNLSNMFTTYIFSDAKCWQQNPLRFRVVSALGDMAYWECYNGSSYILQFNSSGLGANNVYEEAMFWDERYWTNNLSIEAQSRGINTAENYVYAMINQFGSIFAPLGEYETGINSCTNLTVPNYVFTLLQNITGNQSSGKCIDIQANNVTLDCAGYNITGNSSGTTYGIYISGYNNTIIKNCNVNNYSDGIYLVSGSHSNLTNNSAYNNRDSGINVIYGLNNTVSNSAAYTNQLGIIIDASLNNTIINNRVYNNTVSGVGIAIKYYSNYTTLINNTVYNNSDTGIAFSSNIKNNIINNLVYNNKNYGISFSASPNNTLINNTVYNSTYSGITLSGSCNNNTLINNTVYNSSYGLSITSSSLNNIITNNNVSFNSVWDFYSEFNSNNNTVTNLTTNNTISSFIYSGDIYLKSAAAPAGGDPVGYTNIGKYLNITNNSAGAWIYINISYTGQDVVNVFGNSTLRIWKNSSDAWSQKLNQTGNLNSGVDTSAQYVYANISNFSSVFAPMGLLNIVSNFSSFSVNNTVHNTIAKYSANVTNINSISGCIIEHNNSGSFANTSFTLLGGTSAWCNITILNINSYPTSVGWYVWANDSIGTWTRSALQTFNITNTAPNTTKPFMTPSSPVTTDDLYCWATLTDNEDTSLIANWELFKNGVSSGSGSVGVSNGSTTAVATVFSSSTTKGENWSCNVTPSDSYVYGTSNMSDNVTIIDSVPTISQELVFTNASPGHSFNVSANATDADGASDIVNSNISTTSGSCVRISFTTIGSNKQVVYNCTGTALQSTTIKISFNDSSNAYVTTAAGSNAYPNSVPSISSVDVTPDSPNTSSVLTCTPSGWSDADGDSATYHYKWFDDDTGLVAGQISSTFDCGSVSNCDKGDTITCEVTPSDSYRNGTAVNGSELIENTAPTLTSLSFGSNPIKGGDLQVVSAVGQGDADLDALNFYCCNYTTGGCVANSTYNICLYTGTYSSTYTGMNCTYTAPNLGFATIYVNCTTYDGTAYSPAVINSYVENDNNPSIQFYTPPTPLDGARAIANSVTIKINATNNLTIDTCIINFDGVNYTMTNESSGTSINCSYTNNSLVDGKIYSYKIYVNNSANNVGISSSRTFTENTKPATTLPVVNPLFPVTTDNLNCNATFTDNEDGTLIANWTWYKNNVFNSNGQTTGITNGSYSIISTLPSSSTTKGDNWTCDVTPYDSYEYGLQSNPSNQVTILDSAPNPPLVTITPNPANRTDDLNCSVTGSADPDSDTIYYYYNFTNGTTTFTYNTTSIYIMLLSGNLTAGQTWTCTVIPSDLELNGSSNFDSITISNLASTISVFSVNDTNHNINAKYSANITDIDTISGCMIEHNNSGSFANTTFLAIGATSGWCNITILNNNTNNMNITWRIWTNDSLGAWTRSVNPSFLTTNTAPTSTAPTINNTIPYTNEMIKCDTGTFTDFNSDTAVWYYIWYDTDVPISGQTSNTLNLSLSGLDKSDIIICSTMASDSIANETFGWRNSSVPATIQNSVPTISQELVFTNASPGHSFNVSANATDADGASDIVNSNISTTSGSCVRISFTTIGSNKQVVYNCTGTALQSTTIKISFNDSSNAYVTTAAGSNAYPDNAPTTSTVTISPDPAYKTNDLNCSVTGSSDTDGDIIYYYYNFSNGVTSILDYTTETYVLLLSGNLTAGQTWTCNVTPTDTYLNGTFSYDSRTILNSPAIFDSFSINDTNHNINAKYSANVTDADLLSGCLIEHNNSGSFANTSFTPLSGTEDWCNFTILNHNTNNMTVGWYVWTNDSLGAWNRSALQTFITANTIPVLTSVAPNVTNASYGDAILLTTSGASDFNIDNLGIECGFAAGATDACTGAYGTPERTCSFIWPYDDNSNHTIYCRVNDSYGVSSPDYEFNITSNTVVTQCRNLTTANTNYGMTGDISGNQSLGPFYPCVYINESNITLDCAGASITGFDMASTNGIFIDDTADNVTVKNCNVYHYAYGIRVRATTTKYHVIENNIANNNLVSGITVNMLSNSIIRHNTANNNLDTGIYVPNSDNNQISDNTANNNTGYGIYLDSTHSNNLTNNIADGNDAGIALSGTYDSILLDNKAKNNNWDFYSITGSSNNVLTNFVTDTTHLNLTYGGSIKFKSTTAPAGGDPSDYSAVGYYLNLTNFSNDAWAYLNISYIDSDISSLDEPTLTLFKHNGSWYGASEFSTEHGLDSTNNYVYANVTNFGSVFALFGKTKPIIAVPVEIPSRGFGGSVGNAPNITVIEIIDKQGFFVYMNNLVPNTNYKFPHSWPSDLRIDSMSFNDYVTYQTFVANKKDSLSMTAPTENVYQYYTFDNSKLNVTATKVEFQFRTPITWLESTEAKVQNMRLYVYDGITWHELNTDVYEVNGTHIVFNSTDTALYDTYAIAESGAKLKEITFLQVIYSIEKYYNGEIGFIDVLSTISDYYMQKI